MNIANLSVVNNKAKDATVASGVICLSTPTMLENTVVFGNQPSKPAQLEITAGCMQTFSAFAGAGAANTSHNQDLSNPPSGPACAAAALFVDTTNSDVTKWNYVPQKNGTAPCSLASLGTSANAPTNDLAGKTRNMPPSIGCYEP
jgi:hypothetical protein